MSKFFFFDQKLINNTTNQLKSQVYKKKYTIVIKINYFQCIFIYIFYVNYLSKKEYENKKVLVGYNGVNGKEVTMSKFKEDINEIRDNRSTFKN